MDGMILVYVHGCAVCGSNASQIRKVRRYAKAIGASVELSNSRYNSIQQEEHLYYLRKAGLSTSSYQAIIVEDGAVTKLNEWIAL